MIMDQRKSPFERFFRIGGTFKANSDPAVYGMPSDRDLLMAAEKPAKYSKKNGSACRREAEGRLSLQHGRDDDLRGN